MTFQTHNRLSGFTLMELLIVMVIMVMATAIVIPRMTSGEIVILQAQVRDVMALLRYNRRSAIVQGNPQVVILTQGQAEESNASSKQESGHWRSREVTLQWGDKSDSEKDVSDEQDDEDDEKTYKITFYPEGGSSGGELILTYKKKFKAKIKINPITGKVTSDIFEEDENND